MLAADTTAEFGSIALADENGVREEVLVHAPQGFSQVIFGEIEALLERQRVLVSGIELFAGAFGPGSARLRVCASGFRPSRDWPRSSGNG